MNTRYLAALFLVFIGICATRAQDSGSSGTGIDIKFGPKVGLHGSSFLGNDFVDITPKIGAYLGGIAEIPVLFENFYLQPEFILSFQGADVGPGNLNLTYLHLPIMAKYHIIDEVAVEIGPQIGVLLGDNGEDYNADVNSGHFGINFGGGYRMNENFYFQARFGFGLSKVIDETDIKNGIFSIGAAYFF